MKNIKIIATLFLAALFISSCEFKGVNDDPDAVLSAPLNVQLTSLTVNVGFLGGSDLNRFSSLIMQQYSGQSTGTLNQTQQYETYLITGTDQNNLWARMYATVLNDAENIINKANESGSPHYSGIAKILKAYTYQIAVDTWGKIPYFETQLLAQNTKPKYDSDEVIYTEIIKLLDQGIAEVNASTSSASPDSSTIYPGVFSATKSNWIKLANTLKLRIYLHYSEKDPAFAKSTIDALISSSAPVFTSNNDSFKMNFFDVANSRNPIDQFETARPGYLVANAKLVSLMNGKNDPRRPFYFTQFPAGSGSYLGAVSGAPAAANSYSKLHTYLRGALVNATTYTGAAPIRMLTFAEYNFIRAEAALRFSSAGSADTFFTAGITASMQDAGVAATDIATYLTANGTLTGTNAQKLEQIINEKYIANYGVVLEPWSDWRRTGYPTISLPSNATTTFVPRSLFYPQSEIDNNGGNVIQKTGMDVKVFWDTRP
jgi:hypothetical protein